MVMSDIGSFHCPGPRFISRGAAHGNKHGEFTCVHVELLKPAFRCCV